MYDMSLQSMSKPLWRWAINVSEHEGIQEHTKELLIDSSRFGMEAVIAQLETN